MQKRLAEKYAKMHREAVENWREGDIKNIWSDESGNLCIAYESGKWWHYREKRMEKSSGGKEGSIKWHILIFARIVDVLLTQMRNVIAGRRC